jgi:hypothetical protein
MGKVVGLANDRTIKVWDVNTMTLLKSTLLKEIYGTFISMDLSK